MSGGSWETRRCVFAFTSSSTSSSDSAASHVSWPDSKEEKGDFKGRLKQTSLTVWLIEMEDVQDFARRLPRDTTTKKTFVHFLIFQTVFALNHFFFPHQLS